MEYIVKYKEKFNSPTVEKVAKSFEELNQLLILTQHFKEKSIVRMVVKSEN